MLDRNAIRDGNILVIGYGNTLRGDDAVGQHVALAISKWRIPGLAVRAVHQLTPELAEPVSRAERVIFVDGQVARNGDPVTVTRLEAATLFNFLGHTSEPRALLALARTLYGRHADPWLVLVPGSEFALRDGLSAAADRAVAEAIVRIAELIEGAHEQIAVTAGL